MSGASKPTAAYSSMKQPEYSTMGQIDEKYKGPKV
jgi:hypothetical protein